MKFRIKVRSCQAGKSREPWWEDYEKDLGPLQENQTLINQVRVWAEALVEKFNKQEKEMYPENDYSRELLEVEIVDGSTIPKEHKWEKQNLVTISRGGRYFDEMKCSRCGVTAKRFGLTSVVRDSQFASECYRRCDTAIAHLKKKAEKKKV